MGKNKKIYKEQGIMKISLMDRSLYLKGLMLLIRKDRKIRDEEMQMMLSLGEKLGFDKKFCEETIKEILNNKYIIDEPPLFSNSDIAKPFLKDALQITLSDGEAHENELQWLRSVATVNGIDEAVSLDTLNAQTVRGKRNSGFMFEAESFEWE